MKKHDMKKRSVTLLAAAAILCGLGFSAQAAAKAVIICPKGVTSLERFAAEEVRRYVYVCSGELLETAVKPNGKESIFIGDNSRIPIEGASTLGEQDYLLKTTEAEGVKRLHLVGGSAAATLYAAYRFAELLGVRFYLDGDVVPDSQTPFQVPDIDERHTPLFPLRGIQPFHDFPEGPDWWTTEDYQAIIGQLPKLRMNFIGLHTYPGEPTVWIGQPDDVAEDGTVKYSYPARWCNTAITTGWGFSAKKTSDYHFGGAMLFDRDGYGSDVSRGFEMGTTDQEQHNEVFNRTGAMFKEAFAWARVLGVRTCVGTEVPLVIPDEVRQRVGRKLDDGKYELDADARRRIYEGLFTRIARAYPTDYYWFWTPETWTWEKIKESTVKATMDDIFLAIDAARNVRPPFQLATCGWVLGPQNDRSYFDKVLPKDMPVSCINRQVGMEPVEPGFADVKGRSKWAIPWLEDDPAMTSPQLWVGRMRRDAFDALKYGCDGLMGIHWRTRILRPNVAALAQAAWDQSGWSSVHAAVSGVVGGSVASFPGATIADTEDDVLYQTVRYDLSAYRLAVPNGAYTVTLRFCEPHYKEKGKRVFGVKIQGKSVIERLDVFAAVGPNRALDKTFTGVEVTDGMLAIEFVKDVEFPCIAALDVVGPDFTMKINAGGEAYKDYAADLPPVSPHRPSGDFYRDWTRHEFGPEVADKIAAVFEKLDGRLPRPSDWVQGPGGYVPDTRSWSVVEKDYAFVDELAAFRDRIKGAGNLQRFDYWLSTFRYMRATAKMRCLWAEYNQAIEEIKKVEQGDRKKQLAHEAALPARKHLVEAINEAGHHLMQTVNTSGEMGTLANLEQHSFPDLIEKPGGDLEKLLGEPLPADAKLSSHYEGPARIIVPTVRSSVLAGKKLNIKVIILATESPREVAVHWRALGKGAFNTVAFTCDARNTYTGELPVPTGGIEYYVSATAGSGDPLVWPATAPHVNQTVIVAEP